MLSLKLFIVFIYMSEFLGSNISGPNKATSSTPRKDCGRDRLPDRNVKEGPVFIEDFPWLGLLIYPFGTDTPPKTTVILINREIALSTALDIDAYPKDNFRELSRVVLGNRCVGPYIRIREYVLHPDYNHGTFSTLAMLQLDTKNLKLDVFPICGPPDHFSDEDQVYAMSTALDCHNTSMKAFKMNHVSTTRCRKFYENVGLDIQSIWPTYAVCAQASSGGHCIWRSGTALVIRHEGAWKLLGIGIYGPGCASPSRFLDYGMYREWVERSTSRVGQPTVSRIAPNFLVLRRSTKNIPRYGPCDPEESKVEIFSHQTTIVPPRDAHPDVDEVGIAYDNVTLLKNVDYTCLVLHVWDETGSSMQPAIKIGRFCPGANKNCLRARNQHIHYYIVLKFWDMCSFKTTIYGNKIEDDDE